MPELQEVEMRHHAKHAFSFFKCTYVVECLLGFFLGGVSFFFNEKEMYSFFPTVGHEINLLDLDSYLG